MALNRSRKKGFSLIVVAAILAVAAILIVTLLPNDSDKYSRDVKKTSVKLNAIHDALIIYYNAHSNALPYPSSLTANLSSTSAPFFGVGDSTCAVAGVGKASDNNNVCIGGVPVKDLGLPDDYSFDEWGNRFVYAYDTTKANLLTLNNSTPATVNVCDIGTTPASNPSGAGKVSAVVYSTGADGLGTIPRTGAIFSSGVYYCNNDPTNYSPTLSERENCNGNSIFLYNNFSTDTACPLKPKPLPNSFSSDKTASTGRYYDDFVTYIALPAETCPAGVVGCNLWLDAKDGNTLFTDIIMNTKAINGSTIAAWKDKSGFANHAVQTDISHRPIYSIGTDLLATLPTVRFGIPDTSFTWLDAPNSMSSPLTIFLIGMSKENNNSYGEYLDASSNINRVQLQTVYSSTGGVTFGNGSFNQQVTSNSYSQNDALLLEISYNDSGSNAWINAAQVISNQNLGTILNTTLRIGGTWQNPISNSQESLSGDIAEVVIYPSNLSDPNRKKIECYEANKWNLCSSLTNNYCTSVGDNNYCKGSLANP